MIRTTLQSILCLVLSPLLVAQQVNAEWARRSDTESKTSQVIIPKDTELHLIAVETLSSASAKKGDPVRFVVAADVVLEGVVVIPAGTPVIGRVVKVKRGVPKHREGLLRVTLQRLILGSGNEVPLTASDPMYRPTKHQARQERSRNLLENVGGAAFCAALLPICIAFELSIADSSKPVGSDAVLPKCFPANAWTVSETVIKSERRAQGETDDGVPSTCTEGFKIDWSVSSAEMLVIE